MRPVQARRLMAIQATVLAVAMGITLLVGYYVARLLRLADAKAQDAWKPKEL